MMCLRDGQGIGNRGVTVHQRSRRGILPRARPRPGRSELPVIFYYLICRYLTHGLVSGSVAGV